MWQGDLPPVGAFVRLTRDVERFPHFVAHAGERGQVVPYQDCAPYCGVEMDDPPEGSEGWGGVVWWETAAEFLADIEPADLGRDPD